MHKSFVRQLYVTIYTVLLGVPLLFSQMRSYHSLALARQSHRSGMKANRSYRI